MYLADFVFRIHLSENLIKIFIVSDHYQPKNNNVNSCIINKLSQTLADLIKSSSIPQPGGPVVTTLKIGNTI
jgi:hypothetical protein